VYWFRVDENTVEVEEDGIKRHYVQPIKPRRARSITMAMSASDLMWRAIFGFICICGILCAQILPDLNNHVAEVRVTELAQSGNRVKVTVQNISPRTIRGLSIVLGRRRVDQDWSKLAGGGLAPNAIASVTISTAGLPVGGTPHHPAPPGTVEVLAAVFTDGAVAAVASGAEPRQAEPLALPPAKAPIAEIAKTPEDAATVVQPVTKAEPTARPSAKAPSPEIAKTPEPAEAVAQPVRQTEPTPAQAMEVPASQVGKTPEPAATTPAVAQPVRQTEPAARQVPATQVTATPEPAAGVAQPVRQAEPTAPPARELPIAQVARTPEPAATTPAVAQPARHAEAPAPQTKEPPTAQVARTPDNPIPDPPPAKPVPADPRLAIPPATPTNQAPVPRQIESASAAATPPPAPVERSQTQSEIQPGQEAKKVAAPGAVRPGNAAPGTYQQGSKAELAKLISLVEPLEPELATAFPRPALRQMIAAVVTEQNALTAQPDATAFDHGQRSAVQAFVYGLQTIQDRRDLDDDMFRAQVERFLKNQRQTLAPH
jgi:hypothetical protein